MYKDITYHHAAFFWDGRQLSAIKVWSDAGETTLVAQLDYLYNDQGYRIRKTITEGNVVDTWSYDLAGSAVLRETFEHKVGNTVTSTSETFYLRDADGTLTGYVRDGTPYYYLKDLQGNTLAVIDEDGTELIEYEYDPYGNILSLTSWDDFPENPYTYRGYRFDSEIGMYYLNSRYYSPVLSRFLNADGMLGQVGDIASVNMYAYCAGNPILYVDPKGESILIFLIVFMIAAIIVCTVATSPDLVSAVEGLVSSTVDFIPFLLDNTTAYAVGGSSMSASGGLGGSIYDDGTFYGVNMAGGSYNFENGYQQISSLSQGNFGIITWSTTYYEGGPITSQYGLSICGFSLLWDQNNDFSFHITMEATGGVYNPNDTLFYAFSTGIDIDITAAVRDYNANK